MLNKKTATKIFMFVLLVSFIQSATITLVSAPRPPPVSTPNLPGMEGLLWGSGPKDATPYIAGYQDQDPTWPESYSHTEKVNITVSFPDTDPSVIPNDNYIAGGMFLQSVDNVVDNTDYGWVASLSLERTGEIKYNMAFYETYEGDFWPPWLGVGQQYWIRWQKAKVLSYVDPATPVTLTMKWTDDGYVKWYYTIDDHTYWAGSYNALGYRSSMQSQFKIGVTYEWSKWIFFYQFGIYSETEIENSGWNVRLERPQFYTTDGRWKYVQWAKSTNGAHSYMDNWWRWGGERYDGVWARYYGFNGDPGTLPGFMVEFYYAGTTLPSDWTLWDSPPTAPEKPSGPHGPIEVIKGISYDYSTYSIDPNDDRLDYAFDWGDLTGTSLYNRFSGTEVNASHSWSSTGYYTVKVRAKDRSWGLYTWSDPLVVHVISDPSYVDFTTFTESSGENLVQTSTRATATHLRRIDDDYLYKDYGASYFGNFEHKFTLAVTDAEAGDEASVGWAQVWRVSEQRSNNPTGAGKNIGLRLVQDGSDDNHYYLNLRSQDYYGGHNDAHISSYLFDVGTAYYITILRTGASCIAYIHSDEARTNLIEALSVDTFESYAFRYLQVTTAYYYGGCPYDWTSFYVENLEILP